VSLQHTKNFELEAAIPSRADDQLGSSAPIPRAKLTEGGSFIRRRSVSNTFSGGFGASFQPRLSAGLDRTAGTHLRSRKKFYAAIRTGWKAVIRTGGLSNVKKAQFKDWQVNLGPTTDIFALSLEGRIVQ